MDENEKVVEDFKRLFLKADLSEVRYLLWKLDLGAVAKNIEPEHLDRLHNAIVIVKEELWRIMPDIRDCLRSRD